MSVVAFKGGGIMLKPVVFLVALCLVLAACASNTGVVAMGNDKYMIAKQQATGFPGLGNLKAEIITAASQHCAGLGKDLNVISQQETQPPYVLGNYPRAEIQFECVAKRK